MPASRSLGQARRQGENEAEVLEIREHLRQPSYLYETTASGQSQRDEWNWTLSDSHRKGGFPENQVQNEARAKSITSILIDLARGRA